MLSFVIAEEDLQIEMSYHFNKVTAVFLLDNNRFSYFLVRADMSKDVNDVRVIHGAEIGR